MAASAWLDCSFSSNESASFLISGMLCPSSSADSFDLNLMAGDLGRYTSLLSACPSLDSITSVGSVNVKDIPPFTPPAKKHAPLHLVSWEASLVLLKASKGKRLCPNVLVSSPTAPRLMRIPSVKRRLGKWTAITYGVAPPDVEPWTPSSETPRSPWVPEGSAFPPGYFRNRLLEKHRSLRAPSILPAVFDESESSDDSVAEELPVHLPFRRRASHTPMRKNREARVLDKEIHVNTNGKVRRWSMGAPASYMNAELIESRLEFQRLDACMRDDVDTIDATLAKLGEEIQQLAPLPEIMVSTSTTTVPVSVPSAASSPVAQATVAPLAVRRGKRVPSPLMTKLMDAPDLYPGVPTAFLASTPDYSPDVEVSHDPEPSLAVGDMIGNLKSQIQNMRANTPVDVWMDEGLTPWSPGSSIGALSDDEWAFAEDIMAKYSSPPHFRSPDNGRHRARISSPPAATPAKPSSNAVSLKQRSSAPVSASRSRAKSVSSSSVLKPLNCPPAKRERASTGPINLRSSVSARGSPAIVSVTKVAASPNIATSTPVVPTHRHTMVDHATPATPSPIPDTIPATCAAPKSILKHAKSVRFACPTDKDASSRTASNSPAKLRSALKPASPSKPTAIRAAVGSENEALEFTPSAKGQTRTALRSARSSVSSDRRKSRHISMLPTGDVSSLSPSTLSTAPLPAAAEPSPGRWQSVNPRSPPPEGKKASPSRSLRLRKSLPLLGDRDKKAAGKENRPAVSRLSLATTRKHENAGRRGSAVDAQSDSTSQKSRRSTPLKSIFQRLKA